MYLNQTSFQESHKVLESLQSKVKSNDTKKSHFAYKAIPFSLYVSLHWSAILTHNCILKNTTE